MHGVQTSMQLQQHFAERLHAMPALTHPQRVFQDAVGHVTVVRPARSPGEAAGMQDVDERPRFIHQREGSSRLPGTPANAHEAAGLHEIVAVLVPDLHAVAVELELVCMQSRVDVLKVI